MNILKRGTFWEFNQNNSGGYFKVDEQVCHNLLIEAPNKEIAVKIAESKGCYWDGYGDCRCCGDRWSVPWDEDGKTFPYRWDGATDTIFQTEVDYAQYMANQYGWTMPDYRIFYMDGTVKEIFSSKIIEDKYSKKK